MYRINQTHTQYSIIHHIHNFVVIQNEYLEMEGKEKGTFTSNKIFFGAYLYTQIKLTM